MADTPAVFVQSELATLAHKHVSVTYSLIGILVLLMALMGLGGYFALKSFDAQLQRQEQKDTQYQQDRKTFLDTLNVHDADRAAQAQKIADLEAQIKARDSKPLPKPISDGLKPDATAQTVATGLTSVYSDLPSFGAVGVDSASNVALSLPQAQQVIQDRVSLNITRIDLRDTQAVVDLQKQANSSLTNDLGSCKALNVKADADIAGFKKLATRSKFRKFLDGAEKVLIFGAGAYLGHKI